MQLNDNNVIIKYRFTEETEVGTYTDSINFKPSEFEALTEEQLQAKIIERKNAFVQNVRAVDATSEIEALQEIKVFHEGEVARVENEIAQKQANK